MVLCIVCGCSESDVKKMFCFPRQLERSNKWQQCMGLVPQGILSGHVRICAKHFTEDSFIPYTLPLRLRQDAVPTISAELVSASATVQKKLPTHDQQSCSNHKPLVVEEKNTDECTNIVPSSGSEAAQLRGRGSVRKNMDNLRCRYLKNKSLAVLLKNRNKPLRKLKQKCTARGRVIANLLNEQSEVAINNIFKNLSSTTAMFMIGQLRCAKRLPHGRRWTIDEKVMALALYKRSPKCYALLRRITALPSRDTLLRLLKRIPFEVGINKHMLQHLRDCLKSYDEHDRTCIIAFDEMAIREHIQYSTTNDRIEGVEDLGSGKRTEHLARYALVFLAQGILKSWKQPIAYYFTRNGASSTTIEILLNEVINAMHEAKIPVIATVCDMATVNVKAIKNMGATANEPFVKVNNHKIYTLFDVPHLIKCTRNLFRKHNILLPVATLQNSMQNMEAKWTDIVTAYEEDKSNPLIFRSLHKLKDNYLSPLGQSAMKVKAATQTLSRSVSCYIYNLVRLGILPSRALATATFLHEVDAMFDSLNGSNKTPPDGKPYRCSLSDSSGHIQFWEECIGKVNQWRYIRKPDDILNPRPWQPPSQEGWLFTLKAMQGIWNYLSSVGIKYLKQRTLNQDALENLFGGIRSACGSNENPTVTQFVSAIKTQIVNGLANQSFEGRNCEEDDFTLLSNLKSFVSTEVDDDILKSSSYTYVQSSSSTRPINFDVDQIAKEVENSVSVGRLESLSVAYVGGYIVKRLFHEFQCVTCELELCATALEPWNQFISQKEYSEENRKLVYPSEKLVVLVGCAITCIEQNMSVLRKELFIQEKVSTMLHQLLDFAWLSCEVHNEFLKIAIIKSVCRIGVPWYCTRVVRDLRSENKCSLRKTKKMRNM